MMSKVSFIDFHFCFYIFVGIKSIAGHYRKNDNINLKHYDLPTPVELYIECIFPNHVPLIIAYFS